MQMIWKAALGTAVVAVLGFGSVGAMAVASSLTIDDEPGRVQTTAPVSVGGGAGSDDLGTDTSGDAGATPATDAPTPAETPLPADPTSPVAVPPAGSQTIDDADDDNSGSGSNSDDSDDSDDDSGSDDVDDD